MATCSNLSSLVSRQFPRVCKTDLGAHDALEEHVGESESRDELGDTLTLEPALRNRQSVPPRQRCTSTSESLRTVQSDPGR